MVLQSNKRLRAAKRTEGEEYELNGIVYKGSGRKAGTGRSATTVYNVRFIKAMGACCKPGYSDEAIRAIHMWNRLELEYRTLRQLVTQINDFTAAGKVTKGANDPLKAQTIARADAVDVPTLDVLTAGVAGTAATGSVSLTQTTTHANQQAANNRLQAIRVEQNKIRTEWVNKETKNPSIQGGRLPVLVKADGNLMSAADIDAAFPNVALATANAA